MKTYHGERTEDGCRITVHDGRRRPLNPRLDLWNHSPTGFEWGYGGSGPAQTSLAILADALDDDERAVTLHQDFKRKAISGIIAPSWSMSIEEVKAIVKEIELEHGSL